MSHDTQHRAYDDDAPISAGDVVDARRFLVWLGVAGAVGVVFGVVVGLLGILLAVEGLRDWRAQEECEARVQHTHEALALAPPDGAVLHRGDGVVVIDGPDVVALVEDGRVVASSLRCAPGHIWPSPAWR